MLSRNAPALEYTCGLHVELLPDNPYDAMSAGCDFLRDSCSKAIDFATIHLYPDLWLPSASEERRLHFARRWVNCHTDLCTHTLRKPLVVTEFGNKTRGPPRAALYDKVSIAGLLNLENQTTFFALMPPAAHCCKACELHSHPKHALHEVSG